MAKLIFGCGYLGLRVARRWISAADTVYAVTRSAQRAASLAAQGLKPIVADVLRRETLKQLPPADTVLVSIGYDRAAGSSMHDVYVGGLCHALDALPDTTGRIVYVSSTGVYAQNDGSWVDETSPCEPTREGGRACLAAEQLLAQHRLGPRSVVLRMAGLYGPGRLPSLEALRTGEPIAAPPEGYVNLIHIDDAARAVLAAEGRSKLPRLYLVSDGHPVMREAYYRELARLIGAPAPRFVPPAAGAAATRRGASDKRVKNDRLVRELEFEIVYQSYRDGLAAVVTSSPAQ